MIKEALKQRNNTIEYVKMYVRGMNLKISFVLKSELDTIVAAGSNIIGEIEEMFWSDTDFIGEIQEYLNNGDRVILKIKEETGFSHLEEILFCLEAQNKLFQKFITHQMSVPDNKKVFIARNFPTLHHPDSKQDYN